jgi:hypothetical protein
MSSTQLSVGMIILSLGVGFFTYYFISDLAKEKKKTYMGELLEQLMNFVIYIWIGKILLNLSVFIKDPLSILAYPSNSTAFYLAFFASVLTITIKSKRQKIKINPLLNAFIYVFLIASFIYEFIQIVWNDNTYSIRYMGLLAVLIIVVIMIRDRIATDRFNLILLVGWTLGTLGLALRMPFTMVFGYTISPWFLGFILIACLTILIFKKRKKVS